MVENLPAVQKTACCGGDVDLISGSGRPLEKEMAIHCSILAWEVPGTEEPGGFQESDTTYQLNHHHHETKANEENTHSNIKYSKCIFFGVTAEAISGTK